MIASSCIVGKGSAPPVNLERPSTALAVVCPGGASVSDHQTGAFENWIDTYTKNVLGILQVFTKNYQLNTDPQ